MLYVGSKPLSLITLLVFATACNSSGGEDSNSSLSGSVQARAFIVSTATCEFTGKDFLSTAGSTAVIVDYDNLNDPRIYYKCSNGGSAIPALCKSPSSHEFTSCDGEGSISLVGLSTGNYQVQVKSADLENAASALYSFSVDLVAPQISNVAEISKTKTSVTLSFQASDPVTQNDISVPSSGVSSIACTSNTSSDLPSNPNWEDCSAGVYSVMGLKADSDNWIFFRVEDNAGNTNLEDSSPAAVKSVLVHTRLLDPNTENPGLCQISPLNQYTNSNSVTVNYVCPNEEYLNSCKLLGNQGFERQDCNENSQILNFTDSASDGAYAFCVYDGPTSTSSPAACVNFTKDTIAPSVAIDNSSFASGAGTIYFSGNDETSGVTHFTCALENLSSNKLYNAAGQEVTNESVSELLNDSTGNICGSTKSGTNKAFASSVSFSSLILKDGSDYRFHVASWDAAGNKSNRDATQTLTPGSGAIGQFLCTMKEPFNDSWKNSLGQKSSFKCSYNKIPSSLNFQCEVLNERTGELSSKDCDIFDNGMPTLCVSQPNGEVLCSWTGSFLTDSVAAETGDRLKIKVTATDKSTVLNTTLGKGEVSDSFRYDVKVPRLEPNKIEIVSKSSGILATYNFFEPLTESGLGANSTGISCRLNDLDINDLSDAKKYIHVPCDYTSASIVQTDALNFDHHYRLETSVQDLAGNARNDYSDSFEPTYPYEAPSCDISLVGTHGHTVDDPSPADKSKVEIHCNNPSPEENTLAKCLVQARQQVGSTYFTTWQPCSETGLIPQWDSTDASTKYILTLDNTLLNPDDLNPLEIKVKVLPCDPNYPTECGQESGLSYFVGKGRDGGWSAAETFVLNPTDPGLAEYSKKTCNNPTWIIPGNDCQIETGWTEGPRSSDGYRTENQATGICRNDAYSWNPSTQKCSPNCLKILPGSTLTSINNVETCSCVIPNSDRVSVTLSSGGITETHDECKAPCPADEFREPDGTCQSHSSSSSSSEESSSSNSSSSSTSSCPSSVDDGNNGHGNDACHCDPSNPGKSGLKFCPQTGLDGGWSNAERFILDPLDVAQTEYFKKTCNNPTQVLPGADCSIDSGWSEGTRTAEGYRIEYQFSGVCKNSKYEWNSAKRICELKTVPIDECGGSNVKRVKVIGAAVDNTQSVTNWPNPIVTGKAKPGIIYNRYHLNLSAGKSAYISNECPANYTSKFVKASGTDYFKCTWDNNGISCRNKDIVNGHDMDTIEYTCTCKTTPPPPTPTTKPDIGTCTWDNNKMDLNKGTLRKTEGCTQWFTDEKHLLTIDGYIVVGKYNSCTQSWECGNAFKYATQWRESNRYNTKLTSCTKSEINDMRKDPAIMPHCSDPKARNSCYKYSNR